LDPALEALDPRTPLAPARRREFFDRHLARLFPDPAAAAARLFEGVAASAPQPTVTSSPAALPAPPVPASAGPSAPATSPAPAPGAAAPSVEPAAAPPPPLEAAAPAPTATPAAAPPDPREARWRANIHFVLEHLLPILRTRQLRGTVIQTLSDTLGVSAPS